MQNLEKKLEKQIEELQIERARLQFDNAKHKKIIKQLKARIIQLADVNEHLRRENFGQRATIAELRREVSRRQSAIDFLDEENRRFRSKRRDVR